MGNKVVTEQDSEPYYMMIMTQSKIFLVLFLNTISTP